MKIKICGLSRVRDIEFVNEALPDYIGFVFAKSKRKISPVFAAQLRRLLSDEIIPVGVFVNAPAEDIAALYLENVISIAQLHGTENDEYILRLKEVTAAGGKKPVEVIKTVKSAELENNAPLAAHADYYLLDSGAGSGKAFNWELLNSPGTVTLKMSKPWFLAGGIDLDNIGQAMAFDPYAIDVSSGAETDGIKDLEKIIQLVSMVKIRKKS
jgi:phosphoribosylanthranilate isomerase